jgi:hypothetical protein
MKVRTPKNRNRNKTLIVGASIAVAVFAAGAFAIIKYSQSKNQVAINSVNTDQKIAPAKAPMPVPKVHDGKLEACYVTFLKTKPQHDEGTLVVSWNLNKQGEVSNTKLLQNDLKDEKFTQCVLENLKKAQFANVTDATTVAHRYEFKRR